MTRRTRLLSALTVAMALLLCGPVTAAGEDDLDKAISLDLKEADLRMIFDLYGEILGVKLEIDPTVDGTINITFDDITVRTSLNAICESAKCRWRILDGDPAVLRIDPGDPVPTPARSGRDADVPRLEVAGAEGRTKTDYRLDSPVSLKLVDADATTVLETAAKVINAKLLLDRDLKGKTITLNADGVPLSTILDTTCEELDCKWEFTEGDPPTLGVYSP